LPSPERRAGLGGVTIVTPLDACYFRAYRASRLYHRHQVGAGVLFQVPASLREDQDAVFQPQPAGSQCHQFARLTPKRCQWGRIGFQSGDLAEIVDCVGSIGRPPPTPGMNSRPPLELVSASAETTPSTAAVSSCAQEPPATIASGTIITSRLSQHASPFEVESEPHFAQTRFMHRAPQTGLVRGIKHQKAAASSANQFTP